MSSGDLCETKKQQLYVPLFPLKGYRIQIHKYSSCTVTSKEKKNPKKTPTNISADGVPAFKHPTLLYNVTFDAERQRKLIFKTFTKYNFPFFVPLALVHPQMLDYFR